ncbi:MAG: glycosyltransferase family 4 protein [Anaerolineae bacterium]|nr:glycosyltransferase family 4 protein [Anaerolineae bacterium]NUQ06276.1 glycosyltransferase [Anaerolineae bacterium]
MKPKILFTTPQNLHHPPFSGPTLRIENSIKALARIADVILYVRLPTDAIGSDAAIDFYRSFCREVIFAPSVMPAHALFRFARRAGNSVSGRISRRPLFGVGGFAEVLDFRHLAQIIHHHQPDVIWLGYGNISYPLLRYLKKQVDTPTVVDTDSVWSRFVLRELPYAKSEADRRRIQTEGQAKEFEEAWATPLADVTTAVSAVDAEYFRSLARQPDQVQIFANVIDPDSYAVLPPPDALIKRPAVYLAGTFWPGSPMEDAARWTIGQIMPAVWARKPEIRLYIIGAGSDEVLKDISHPQITITGRVHSVLPYLCHVDASLVPLRFESGTRFKILEAGVCGVPVISTHMGAEGLGVTHGRDILIADDEEAFASAICDLIDHPERSSEMGRALKALVLSDYSIETLAQQGQIILDHLMSKKP